MRRALRQNPARRAVSRPATIPAPVEGWDASSPLANMDPKRAIILENFFPEPTHCRLRRGFASHATGVGAGAVESLMAWQGPSSAKLFAAGGTAIYDVTTAGAASSAVTGLTNARLQHVNFTTAGGHYLWVCNGDDAPQHYDGTTWAAPAITGITAANIIGVAAHKRRLWFVMKNSSKAAYLPVDSIAGAATEFDLGPLFTLGGYLMAIGTWTIDGGAGVDDMAVFVSSQGEIAVYQGTDPSTAADWALIGVFRVGAPLGRRCLTKVAGDIAIVTVDGVLPLSKALATDRGAARAVAITSRIANAVNEATRLYRANFGWQLIGYPKGTMAILNVPAVEGQTSEQYAMNTLTGAWCKFTGMNAACWGLLDDDVYFGGMDGTVYKADTGVDDDGASITYDMQPAWNYFGSRGRLKRFHMLAPLLGTDGAISPALDLLGDYENRLPQGSPTATAASGSLWDEDEWDVAEWASADEVFKSWTGATALGSCATVRMRGQARGAAVDVFAFDLLYEPGEFI